MPSQHYFITHHEGLALAGRALQIAKVLTAEMEGEIVSWRGIQGLIRIAADAAGIGQYLNMDQVLRDFKSSGYLSPV